MKKVSISNESIDAIDYIILYGFVKNISAETNNNDKSNNDSRLNIKLLLGHEESKYF